MKTCSSEATIQPHHREAWRGATRRSKWTIQIRHKSQREWGRCSGGHWSERGGGGGMEHSVRRVEGGIYND